MPSVLILCAHRPHRSPSQRYRFEQYLSFLESKGFHFTYSFLLNAEDDITFYAQGGFLRKVWILFKSLFIRFKDLRRFKKFDIIFIQREALFIGSSYFEKKAAASGAKLIFDFDDSIWLADTSPANKKWEWIKRPEKIFETFSVAHVVMAGNKFLEDKAKIFAKHVYLVPTTIDTRIHIPKPELRHKEQVQIGWSGSISTVKHFELLIPVFKALKNKYNEKINFVLIGDKNYSHPHLEVTSFAWTEAQEVDLLNSLDIGVMPLPDDEWANGKCGLKGLSYMACGVASVLADVGVNKSIIQHGKNGFLAQQKEDWLKLLSELIENSELRTQLGNNGRKTVEDYYSVEQTKENYLKIFKEVLRK